MDGVPYNLENGPSNLKGAALVSAKQVLDEKFLQKLNSARVIAESQLASLNRSVEEAKKVLSDLEGAIADLDPEK